MQMKYTLYIGRKIRALRRVKGWSQERLAKAACCSPKTISNLENNKYIPDLKRLIMVCNALNTSLEEVLSFALRKNADPIKVSANKPDEYPLFVKRIPIRTTYSATHLEHLEAIAQKLPYLSEAKTQILCQLLDLW